MGSKVGKLVKSQKAPFFVIPAKAGIQENQPLLGSRLRGSDGLRDFLRDRQGYHHGPHGPHTSQSM